MNIFPKVKCCTVDKGFAGEGYEEILNADLPKEGYEIFGDEWGVRIFYGDSAGLFYGKQTLEEVKREYGQLPVFHIEDSPKYRYRGYHFDCCRHFFTVEEVKKIADIASRLKLNYFHWHLTDDQGWRAEIKKYPLLTGIGSKRKETLGDGKPVEGFYSQEEMREIVEYCKERFITVVPEVDMPGHFTAALAAYPEMSCDGNSPEVATAFGIFRHVACAGKSRTREFLKDILREIMDVFPSEYIHIGGDEALKINWRACPDCREAMERMNCSEEELQGDLMSEMAAFLNENGRKAIMWNDGLYGENVKGDYAIQYWKVTKTGKKVVDRALKEGKDVIFSPCMHYYLDYPHGLTTMRKTYSYKVPKKWENAAAGLEGTMWAEYVPDDESAEKHFFPRLFAIADRAWGGEGKYSDFVKRKDKMAEYLHEIIDFAEEKDPDPWAGKRLKQIFGFLNNVGNKYNRPQMADLKLDARQKRKNS